MRFLDSLSKCGCSLLMTSKESNEKYCASHYQCCLMNLLLFGFCRQIMIENQEWNPLPANTTKLKYMNFGNDRATFATQIDEPFAERMRFWDSLNLPWKIDV